MYFLICRRLLLQKLHSCCKRSYLIVPSLITPLMWFYRKRSANKGRWTLFFLFYIIYTYVIKCLKYFYCNKNFNYFFNTLLIIPVYETTLFCNLWFFYVIAYFFWFILFKVLIWVSRSFWNNLQNKFILFPFSVNV